MKMVLRRLLAATAVVTALLIGSGAMVAQAAPTPTPTPTSSATQSATPGSADPSPTAVDEGDTEMTVTPDAPIDNTRIVWVLGGVGLVAVIAAAVVIARH
ncbi:MAG: hypothetical protein CVT62_04175 [Actinobacteria bacterium HGW-Actinobacteria-2]|nr:MAG: hypothetical protein CVT62_04175 [Actinobacteria bacterium HGW-Actinobacteria-2]